MSSERETRRAAYEECVQFIESAEFLCDSSPEARISRQIAAALRREFLAPGIKGGQGGTDQGAPGSNRFDA